MMAWTNAEWAEHKPAAIADGIYPDSNYAESNGPGLGQSYY